MINNRKGRITALILSGVFLLCIAIAGILISTDGVKNQPVQASGTITIRAYFSNTNSESNRINLDHFTFPSGGSRAQTVNLPALPAGRTIWTRIGSDASGPGWSVVTTRSRNGAGPVTIRWNGGASVQNWTTH